MLIRKVTILRIAFLPSACRRLSLSHYYATMPDRRKFDKLVKASQEKIVRKIGVVESYWEVKLAQAIDEDIRPQDADPREWGRGLHDALPKLAQVTIGNASLANAFLRVEVNRRLQGLVRYANSGSFSIIPGDVKRAAQAVTDAARATNITQATTHIPDAADAADDDDDSGNYTPSPSPTGSASHARMSVTRFRAAAASATQAVPVKRSEAIAEAQRILTATTESLDGLHR